MTTFWTSRELTTIKAWGIVLYDYMIYAPGYEGDKSMGLSIRCLKD
jgi:hypothetical protein